MFSFQSVDTAKPENLIDTYKQPALEIHNKVIGRDHCIRLSIVTK